MTKKAAARCLLIAAAEIGTVRPRGEVPLYRISADDRWANETRRRIAIAIANWLDQDGKALTRVCDLTMREFEGMAESACVEYIAAREQRWQTEHALDDTLKDLGAI